MAAELREGFDEAFGSNLQLVTRSRVRPFRERPLPTNRQELIQATLRAGLLDLDATRRLAAVVLGLRAMESRTIEDEMRAVLEVFASRHREFSEAHFETVILRFGLGGSPPATLEESGASVGVTRERARQVTVRFAKLASAFPPWTPVLDAALEHLREAAPLGIAHAEGLLVSTGFSRDGFSISSLLSAAELFCAGQPPLSVNKTLGLVVSDQALDPALVVKVAKRRTEHWGVTTVTSVYQDCVEDHPEYDEAFVRAVIDEAQNVRWLDPEHEYFWVSSVARNRLRNEIMKIMSVAGSISVGELREGVGRHHRMVGISPPSSILIEFCNQIGCLQADTDRVVGLANLPRWEDTLDGIDLELTRILFDEGPVMRKDDLIDLAVAAGLNRSSVGVFLTYSPVLHQYARGVWGLRGSPVSASEVAALIPPLKRARGS